MRQRRAQQLTHLDANNSELKTEISTLQQQLTHLANHNRELITENAALKQELMNIKAALVSPYALQCNMITEYFHCRHQQR